MENISIEAIRHFVEVHAIIVYFVIFLGVVIEGEVVVIFAGIFAYLGSINIFLALVSVISGGIAKSYLGYTIGFYLNKYHAHNGFISKIEKRIGSFLPRFDEKPFWSIFISRFFILGIGWFTLVFSGYRKVPLRIYARAEALSLGIWSVGVIALGYFFSYTAISVSRDVRNFLLLILLFFILFFILEKVVGFIIELFEIRKY